MIRIRLSRVSTASIAADPVHVKIDKFGKVLVKGLTEPGVGLEPTTYRLQGGCSTN